MSENAPFQTFNSLSLLFLLQKTIRFQPKLGDIIEISEGGNKYWAVFVGDKHVIHLSGPGKERVSNED